MRRTLIIITSVVLILIALVLGFVFRKKSPEPNGKTTGLPAVNLPINSGETTNLPDGSESMEEVRNNSLSLVVKEPSLAFTVLEDGSVLSFSTVGSLTQTRGNGTETILTTNTPDIFSASFSADHKYLLISYGDKRSVQHSVLNIQKSSWQPLPPEISEPTWSPSGARLAYLITTPSSGGIAIVDVEKPSVKPQLIANVSLEEVYLLWPNEERIVFGDKPNSAALGSVWDINIKTKEVRSLSKNVFGSTSIWNKSVRYGLIFKGEKSRRGGGLSLKDSSSNFSRDFGFFSLPSKCVFEERSRREPLEITSSTKKGSATSTLVVNNYILCGSPKNADAFYREPLPDSYLDRSMFSVDEILEVGIETGIVSVLYSPATEDLVDITKPTISGDGLYFINRFDNKVYSFALDKDR